MSQIEKLTYELDQEMIKVYDEYLQFHKELDVYRGKPIGDHVDEVNRILAEIQQRFVWLYPAYHFIAMRHQSANNAVNSYNEFIESIKKAGAQQDQSAGKA